MSLFYQLLKCPQTRRTLIGTEAPFAVVIIALGASAPHLAVAAPGRGAGLVGVSQESEGKDARAPLCVSSHGGHRCWERQQDRSPQSLMNRFVSSISLQNSWFVIHCEWRRCGKQLWQDAHTSISNLLANKPPNYRPLIFYQREIMFNLA